LFLRFLKQRNTATAVAITASGMPTPSPTLRPVFSAVASEVEPSSEPDLVPFAVPVPDRVGPRDCVELESIDVWDENIVVLAGSEDGVIVMRPLPVGFGG
jgi:hypothetical protein